MLYSGSGKNLGVTQPRSDVYVTWLCVASVLVVFWVARNIPCYPFTILAP